MAPSSVSSVLFLLVAALAQTSNGFTISLAPLLTTRLGLGPWGSNSVGNFPSPSSSSPSAQPVNQVTKAKPEVQNFKFEYDDIRMISHAKSEALELIYAKSLDRGFDLS
ncbi:hypothetical protein ACHAWF_006569 [Thalassiosira exigua]